VEQESMVVRHHRNVKGNTGTGLKERREVKMPSSSHLTFINSVYHPTLL
jgi:hypothetical protein